MRRTLLGLGLTALLLALTACGGRSPTESSPVSPPAIARFVGSPLVPTNTTFGQVTFLSDHTGWVTETASSVLLHTRDGGQHWMTERLPGRLIPSSLAFWNGQDGVAAASTLCTALGSPCDAALLRTVDGGRHWTVTFHVPYESLGEPFVTEGALSKTGSAVYVELGGKLFTSINQGASWTPVPAPPGIAVLAAFFTGPGTGFAASSCPPAGVCTSYHLFRTTDNGRHWTPVWTGAGAPTALQMVTPEEGYLLTAPANGTFSMGGAAGTLYRTSDGGESWTTIQSTWTGASQGGFQAGMTWATPTVGWIPVDAGAGPLFGGLDVTTDGGLHWTRLGVERAWTLTGASLLSATDGYIVGSSRLAGEPRPFLLHTTNGGATWTEMLPRLSPTQTLDMVSSQVGYGIGTAENPSDLLATRDGGHIWRRVPFPSTGSEKLALVDFSSVEDGLVVTEPRYIGEGEGLARLYQTRTGGRTWMQVGHAALPMVNAFSMGPSGNGLLVASSPTLQTEMLLVTNGGRRLQRSPYPVPPDATVAPAPESFPRVYVVTAQGVSKSVGSRLAHALVLQDVNVRTGHVQTVHVWSDAHGQVSYDATALSMLPGGTGYLFSTALTSGNTVRKPAGAKSAGVKGSTLTYALWKTANYGAGWVRIAVPARIGNSLGPVTLDFVNPNAGFLLSAAGLYRTDNGGTTWRYLGGGG